MTNFPDKKGQSEPARNAPKPIGESRRLPRLWEWSEYGREIREAFTNFFGKWLMPFVLLVASGVTEFLGHVLPYIAP